MDLPMSEILSLKSGVTTDEAEIAAGGRSADASTSTHSLKIELDRCFQEQAWVFGLVAFVNSHIKTDKHIKYQGWFLDLVQSVTNANRISDKLCFS